MYQQSTPHEQTFAQPMAQSPVNNQTFAQPLAQSPVNNQSFTRPPVYGGGTNPNGGQISWANAPGGTFSTPAGPHPSRYAQRPVAYTGPMFSSRQGVVDYMNNAGVMDRQGNPWTLGSFNKGIYEGMEKARAGQTFQPDTPAPAGPTGGSGQSAFDVIGGSPIVDALVGDPNFDRPHDSGGLFQLLDRFGYDGGGFGGGLRHFGGGERRAPAPPPIDDRFGGDPNIRWKGWRS